MGDPGGKTGRQHGEGRQQHDYWINKEESIAGPACYWQAERPKKLAQPAADRRLEEFVKHSQNSDADNQERAAFDGQLVFHFLNVALQFRFGGLKFGSDRLNIVLQFGLDLLKVGLDFVNVVL